MDSVRMGMDWDLLPGTRLAWRLANARERYDPTANLALVRMGTYRVWKCAAVRLATLTFGCPIQSPPGTRPHARLYRRIYVPIE